MAWQNLANERGRTPRTTFAVRRNAAGGANLLIPADVSTPAFMKALYDPETHRLGYVPSSSDDFKVRRKSERSASEVTIPKAVADAIPYGTTDAEVTYDGDMMVLDLNQFRRMATAAE